MNAFNTGAIFTNIGLGDYSKKYASTKKVLTESGVSYFDESTGAWQYDPTQSNKVLSRTFTEDQADFMTPAIMAGMSGQSFDYSMFTDEEMEGILDYWQGVLMDPDTSQEVKDDIKKTMEDVYTDGDPLKGRKDAYDEQARTAATLAEYTHVLEKNAEALGTSTDALKLYGDTIAGVNGELQALNRATAEQVVQEYKFNKSYNEGISTFKDAEDAYDKWIKSVNSNGKIKISYDVADEVAKIKKSLEGVLGSEVSSDFLNKYNKEIKKLFTGTEKEAEEAYKFLQEKLGEEAWSNLGNRIIKNAKQIAAQTGEAVNVTIEE